MAGSPRGPCMDPLEWMMLAIIKAVYDVASSSILHGLQAKGRAAAFANSKKSMWPVAEV